MRKKLLLAVLLLGASLSATAQNYYVIHNGNNFLAHTGETTIGNEPSFNATTCLWTISDNNIVAISPDGTTGNKLGYTYSGNDDSRAYTLRLTANSDTWTDVSSSPYISYTYTSWFQQRTAYRYLRINGSTWEMTATNSNRATVTGVTRSTSINNIAGAFTGAAITSGDDNIYTTGTSTYTAQGLYVAAHSTTTVTFTCANPSINSSTIVGDVPAATPSNLDGSWTKSWSVSPTTYGTINATTGELTITSLPTSVDYITITFTATKDAQTLTATKTVMLAKDEATYEGVVGSPTGVASSTVTLNDFEPHEWAYYSDSECPIHSLNPANVKISYYGNGTGNMTNNNENGAEPSSFSANATGVQVGPNDAANTFVYYKTLERANANGTGNLSYTTIPNPFQVRPTGTGSASPTRTVYVSGRSRGGAANNTYKIQVTYYDADNVQRTWSDNSNNNVNTTITAKVGTTLTVTAIGRSGNQNNRVYSTITAQYDNNSGSTIATATTTNNNYDGGTSASGTIAAAAVDNTVMRGFYAWRIKSLSTGLTIVGHSVGDTVRAESPIQFQTANEYGNTVEFEALWAQAQVQVGSTNLSSPYANTVTGARERNFHVVNASTTAASFQKTYPCTVIGHLPGSTTLNATRNVTGAFTGAADTKFEDVNITDATNQTWTANNHDLIIGRGCSGTVNYVRGINGGSVTSPKYTLRLESGTFNYVSFLSGYSTGGDNSTDVNGSMGGTPAIKGVLGCDYDRATNKGITNNLIIQNGTFYGYGVAENNDIVYSEKAIIVHVKSGKIGNNFTINNSYTADAAQSFYIGIAADRVRGHRQLFVEGGELASIAGGIDATQNQNNNSLTIRMTGGHVRGAIYGGGARSAGYGNRKFVITGGDIVGWVGGGCNGETMPANGNEDTYGGITYGSSKVYFGGTAVCGGPGSNVAINGSIGGTVFGAGKGVEGNTTSGRMSQGTTVVIADECDIERNVYGGGNFGYAQTSTAVYVSGGTVHGDIFGGSNQNNGPDIDITMKAGTIDGGLYGGCNTSGSITGHINVDVYGTDPAPSADAYALGQVFGGGNQADYAGTPNVTVHCGENISIGYVYGGGNAATVQGTNVVIEGGNKIGHVFGGCYGDNVTTNGTKVNIKGGTIGQVFGGNNQSGTITGAIKVRVHKDGTCPLKIGELYGGGNIAGSAAGSIDIGCTGAITDDHTEHPETIGYTLEGIGDVFGGANQAPISTNISLTIDSGMVYRVFGGNNNSGAISGTITVNVGKVAASSCGWYVGYVYGGGFNASYSKSGNNNPSVNITAGKVSYNVYGGGKGHDAVVTANPTVTLSGTAEVGGNVYGGGDAAEVSGNTSVILRD